MPQYVLFADHSPDICPSSNAKTRARALEGTGEQLPKLAQEAGVRFDVGPLHGADGVADEAVVDRLVGGERGRVDGVGGAEQVGDGVAVLIDGQATKRRDAGRHAGRCGYGRHGPAPSSAARPRGHPRASGIRGLRPLAGDVAAARREQAGQRGEERAILHEP